MTRLQCERKARTYRDKAERLLRRAESTRDARRASILISRGMQCLESARFYESSTTGAM